MDRLWNKRKGVMGPIISVFVMVLVISILAGLTFLFVATLKNTTRDTSEITLTITNESAAYVNSTGYTLSAASSDALARGFSISEVWNNTDALLITSGNYTLSSTGVLTNATATTWADVNVSYTYKSASSQTSYQAVNDTEAAGAGLIGYLPLIFLAVIFGAILTLVLRIILPYINLGKSMDGF